MGFFNELVDSFTGAGAKRSLQEGMDKSAAALREGRDSQIGAIRASGTEARGYMQPYADQGGRSYGLYNDTLGVNGEGARTRAQDLYNSDNLLAQNRALDLKRSGWQQNASGGFNSGTAALADSRVRLQNYDGWQNKLAQNGQVGFSAAGNLSGIAQNEGNQLSGAYGGYGQNLANVYGQGYGQLALANNTFAQNIIGAAGTAARAMSGGVAPGAGKIG